MTNVLIVDDSDVDRLLMDGLLARSSGFVTIQAQNGVQALKKLDEWAIDVVLTDLQMPKMDGLQLVEKIREGKWEIPVILTTGIGSEEIAAKALRAGAAGYIPKNKLNQMLVSTVRDVLELFHNDQSHKELLACSKVSHFEFNLPMKPELIPVLVGFIEKMLKTMTPLDRIDCLRIAVAVDQALQNALFRGNLEIPREHKVPSLSRFLAEGPDTGTEQRMQQEPYKSRIINVVIEIKPNGFAIRIKDEGPGFDTSQIGDLTDLSSRGANLMQAFMDSVKYNTSGNTVKMMYLFDRVQGKELLKRDALKQQDESKRSSIGRIIAQSTGETYEINNPKFVIGRRSACHLRLQDDDVAPLHCMLVKAQDHLMLLNLTPEFETLVNGTRSNGIQLKQGDEIQIGKQKFKFEASA